MKIYVLDYSILDASSPNQRIIFDIKIIEGDGELSNTEFIDQNGELSFRVKSVGHYNATIKDVFPLTVDVNNSELDNYRGMIFTNTNF
nr:hypothetical protein [uncultured Flavobacterium sp.]